MSGSKTRGNSLREILKFIQIAQFKAPKDAEKTAGFTLIELLVGLILAFLVITPLLGFVVNMMDTDRKEQAKTTSEQELQAAADYITRDLQQAVYIYDDLGIDKIKNGLPQDPKKVPVLVFWKRKFLPKTLPVGNNQLASCPNGCDDVFVYSLVVYYLTVNDTTGTWSEAAQIRRLEIQDGVKKPDGTYFAPNDPKIGRDKGFYFNLGQLKGANLAAKMNSWKPGKPPTGTKDTPDPEAITKQAEVLVDYIDSTTTAITPNLPKENCPPNSPANSTVTDQWRRVPKYTGDPAQGTIAAGPFQTYSFYACVYSSKNTAQVFLRGNALARIKPQKNLFKYDSKNSAYFPTARIEVTGSSGFGNN